MQIAVALHVDAGTVRPSGWIMKNMIIHTRSHASSLSRVSFHLSFVHPDPRIDQLLLLIRVSPDFHAALG